jgi:hypothetical protein
MFYTFSSVNKSFPLTRSRNVATPDRSDLHPIPDFVFQGRENEQIELHGLPLNQLPIQI